MIRLPNIVFIQLIGVVCLVLAAGSCQSNRKAGLYFALLKSGHTGIDFNNEITESDSVNLYENEYMYNGSGVGIGDFNNDGLPDLFFAGSMVSSRLYINKGDFKFEDITQSAGIATSQWCTGVSVVDINNDGFMDIYVCSSHSHDKNRRRNLLFVNDGKLHFTEQAAAYGLADTGFSTQATFFDYDGDGDVDMYLLNHNLYSHTANDLKPKDTSGNSPAQDRLYRNNGVTTNGSHPVFEDVSLQAGIKEDGYGLGIAVTDVNGDNRPDIYVANDYLGNDLLWMNNGNGHFTNIISSSLKHQSYNSMGVDAADINNDGLPDLAVMDMLPETGERKKMMFNATSQEKYEMQQRFGYEPEFVRNMLQLNNGTRLTKNRKEPFYSEIGQLAGTFQTDWSWSVLLADFDNDGYKDMHITNGEAKDVTNNDFTAFNASHAAGNYTFNGSNASTSPDVKTVRQLRKNLDEYGNIKIDNYLFRNKGNLTFSNITNDAGLDNPSVSQGAAYADLDNDGDLDLVINNTNEPAFIYRNEMRQSASDSTANFLTIQLQGSLNNRYGLGAKITLFQNDSTQFAEQSPVRGYESSVDYRIHFGVGNRRKIDSLKIEWPDGRIQTRYGIKTNQIISLSHTNASQIDKQQPDGSLTTLLTDVSWKEGTAFKHIESPFFDYAYQRALPQKFSQLGPCIAKGDMNGDGLEDFFIGGAAYQSGKLFFQKKEGGFASKNLVEGMKQEEDLGVQLFDADGDGDLDLLISGGSSEFGANSAINSLRLYNNDGKGNFAENETCLPLITNLISKTLSVADYDGDGDMDVFVGAYVMPQQYPNIPRSYLLRNDHGTFTDVTANVCPLLQKAGMITGAVWADINGDKKSDLILCGEWMPLRFFINENNRFKEITGSTGLQSDNGMWRCLQAVDVDKDGDADFIAGNMGLNNKYSVSPSQPAMLYAKDIDKNGSVDLVPAYYQKNNKGKFDIYPAIDRNLFSEEVPSVKKKYLLYADYAKTTMPQVLSDYNNEGWTNLRCDMMQSVWIENKGNNKFAFHPLPIEAQLAPLNSIVITDVNRDGNDDVLLAGNEYETESMTGRYDALYGCVLLCDGKGAFSAVSYANSGFIIDGDVRSLQSINIGGNKRLIVAGINNDSLRCFAIR